MFTYANQPLNGPVWHFGEAVSLTMKKRGGDWIDTGLQLLLELQNKGYGIVAIADVPSKPAASLTEDEMVERIIAGEKQWERKPAAASGDLDGDEYGVREIAIDKVDALLASSTLANYDFPTFAVSRADLRTMRLALAGRVAPPSQAPALPATGEALTDEHMRYLLLAVERLKRAQIYDHAMNLNAVIAALKGA